MPSVKEIQLCQEILGVCLEINAKGDLDIQFELAGHVKWISVWIYTSGADGLPVVGWGICDRQIYISDSTWNKQADCIHYLEGLLADLRAIQNGDVLLSTAEVGAPK